ncbi:UDP-N-acetylmuramoyl-L-alanyl-D-glutamate--2,6-diaminopimelate ligase [Thermovibrio ammonificans]|nr:UDP-N-acetylmuramoyl-L-alanyl-D-glutamate--2,6-diaminopimelate ligase [Thermovibrio ammonificans]
MTADSREVKPGFLFFAVRGTKVNGNTFAEEALKKGASAVVTDSRKWFEKLSAAGKPVLLVENSRKALATAAANLYGNPQKELKILGVTGTNGKTTTTFLLFKALNRLGVKAGIIGTVSWGSEEELHPSSRTTPSAVELFKMLKELKNRGCEFVVCEVSSHGLHQHRVHGIEFEGAIFTNLTPEHLDYHGNLEEYFLAKAKLFRLSKLSVVNRDDPYGTTLSALRAVNGGKTVTYGKKSRNYTIEAIDPEGSVLIGTPKGAVKVKHNLKGEFNGYNVTAAFSLLSELGFEPLNLKEAFKNVKVPGRMEEVVPGVFVDYAHTPDALQKALNALKKACSGRLIVVFGCGGDRDRTKRPVMGKIAATLADSVIVTSDNPRSEPPEQIAKEVVAGIPEELRGKVTVELDRKRAIELALRGKGQADYLLIAGKGHENYQEVAGKKLPFSDQETVRELYGRKNAGGNS